MNDRIGNLAFPKQVCTSHPLTHPPTHPPIHSLIHPFIFHLIMYSSTHPPTHQPTTTERVASAWRQRALQLHLSSTHPPTHPPTHPLQQEGGFGMEQRAYSENTAQAMDEEAKKLVDEAYK